MQYWKAVQAAQLLPDLLSWAEGEMTTVGSRGITLSGGQRARLALAHLVYRCLVSRIDVVILDDILAAVDVHVARDIVEEALLGVIVDGRRTVVMVMNSNFVALKAASRVVSVEGGHASIFQDVDVWLSSACASTRQVVSETMADISSRMPDNSKVPPSRGYNEATAAHVEEPQKGALNISTVGYYFGAGHVKHGLCCLTVFFVITLSTEAFRIYTDYLMGQWAAVNEVESDEAFRQYILWIGIALFAAFFRGAAVITLAKRASSSIHARILAQMVTAPSSFFDTVPLGQIMGHFSKDLDALDALLPQFGLDFTQDLTLLFGVICVCVWSTPPAAIGVVPVLLGFYKIRTFFSCTARETKRMDSATRGPLYSAVADASEGLATIRAHRQERSFIGSFSALLDNNGKVFFQTYILTPWCILVLDSLGALIVGVVSLSCVFLQGSIPVSISTMAITYALMTRGKLQFGVRMSIEVENQLIAVERVKCFEEGLPQELDEGAAQVEPWPSEGVITFQKVCMRYRHGLPLVLQGLDLEVASGTKVGIVGRTGSGKSSILNAVLRMVDLEHGTIKIDNVNILDVSLKKLRSSISIIPQDPILWSGSLIENIDPSGSTPSDQIIAALDKVGLKDTVQQLGGLRAPVEPRGGNLSPGQKQLFCIVRCVLRDNRIALIDEATSCVDLKTDALIQEAFHTLFVGCTVLVIAHRIQTVLDSDRVAVLEAGKVAEFGQPRALQADSMSLFAALVSASDEAQAAENSGVPSTDPPYVNCRPGGTHVSL